MVINLQKQVAQLWQRDRAAVISVVCCAYARKVHCAVVGSCYTPGSPCTEHVFALRGRRFSKRVGHFWPVFDMEGGVAKTRVIAVSCGIKISAVHHVVLSQYTRLTDGRMNRQNCDSNTMRCITCSRMVKIVVVIFIFIYSAKKWKIIMNVVLFKKCKYTEQLIQL